MKKERESFVFKFSWAECLAQSRLSDRQKLGIYEAIIAYAGRREPVELPEGTEGLFAFIRHDLDHLYKAYERRCQSRERSAQAAARQADATRAAAGPTAGAPGAPDAPTAPADTPGDPTATTDATAGQSAELPFPPTPTDACAPAPAPARSGDIAPARGAAQPAVAPNTDATAGRRRSCETEKETETETETETENGKEKENTTSTSSKRENFSVSISRGAGQQPAAGQAGTPDTDSKTTDTTDGKAPAGNVSKTTGTTDGKTTAISPAPVSKTTDTTDSKTTDTTDSKTTVAPVSPATAATDGKATADASVSDPADPVSLEQVRQYVSQARLSVNPDRWYAYYCGRGWVKPNGQRLTDWRASLRAWQVNGLPNLVPAGPRTAAPKPASRRPRVYSYAYLTERYRRFPLPGFARLLPAENRRYARVEECRELGLECDVWDDRQCAWIRQRFGSDSPSQPSQHGTPSQPSQPGTPSQPSQHGTPPQPSQHGTPA